MSSQGDTRFPVPLDPQAVPPASKNTDDGHLELEPLYRTGTRKTRNGSGGTHDGLDPDTSQHTTTTPKTVHSVWDTVKPQIADLVRDLKIPSYTIRSVSRSWLPLGPTSGEEDRPGVYVVNVGVHPGSVSVDTAREVSEKIIEILEKHGVDLEKVEVMWNEYAMQQLIDRK